MEDVNCDQTSPIWNSVLLSPITDKSPILPISGNDVLICAPNWLGDSIISMPAVQAFKARIPGTRITVLTKDNLVELWRMNPDVDAVIPTRNNLIGTLKTASIVKTGCFDEVFVLPHSLRTALIPFLKRIPIRWGLDGFRRGFLLTHPVKRDIRPGRKHRVFEYLDILGLGDAKQIPLPRLVLSNDAVTYCWQHLVDSGWIFENPASRAGDSIPLVGLIPGAARGRAKQWPCEYFAEMGWKLVREAGCKVIVFGTKAELHLCRKVAERIGARALNMAGKTSISELAVMLSLCRTVVANDSGGMHLAAAMGVPVVAIFGATDPVATAPINPGQQIVRSNNTNGKERIKPNDSRAMKALRDIEPDEVFRRVVKVLATPSS